MTSTISIVEYGLLEVCTLFDPKAPVEREPTVALHADNFLCVSLCHKEKIAIWHS